MALILRSRILTVLVTTIISNLQLNGQALVDYKWQTLECSGEPVERHEAAFVESNDMFYLIGGRRIQEVSIFNPETNTWSSGAKPPIELHHFQGVSYKGEIYVIGAQTGNYPHETSLQKSYIYQPKTDTWKNGPELPADRVRGSSGTAVYKDQLFMVCGIVDGHWNGHVTWFDSYDFTTGKWEKLPDAPRSRDHFNAVVCMDKLYLLGGRVTSGAEGKVFSLTVPEVDVYDFETKQWSTLNDSIITQRAGCMSISINGKILLVGGESTSQKIAHSEVECFNPQTGKWSVLPSLNRGRHGSQLVWHNNKLYVASGSGNRGGSPELKSIECFGK